MDPGKAAGTAAGCRHYAMCKIDCLGTGVCPSGSRNRYVSFYPQGMMDIYAAISRGELDLTPELVRIAGQCTLCGICDAQCYFVTELRPLSVAGALKEHVERALQTGEPSAPPEDPLLPRLREITGDEWATSDPAHLTAYANDPCPISVRTMPRCVVLPGSTGETAEVVALCRSMGVEYSVRGNGSSVMGFVLSPGVVIDTARMDRMSFDPLNRAVTVGAGVSSMELQREAVARGFRVNAAEPAALYCANIVCSGIFSLFSSSYGTGADNVIDARFVSPEGKIFTLGDRDGPDVLGFRREERPAPGICTEAVVRLHPVLEDESAIAVPFPDMASAVEYARKLNTRGVGLGIGVLGVEYLSTFVAPTSELAAELRVVFREDLGMEYLVVVLGNQHHLEAAGSMAPVVIDQELMSTLILGMTSLQDDGFMDLLTGLEGEKRPYEILAGPGMLPLVQAVLDPSPRKLASSVAPDLREFYEELYSRPELTDMMWLNTFRIVSSRMGREGHVVAFIIYVPLDDIPQIERLHTAFAGITGECGVRGDFGFLTPVDGGSMGVLEWDMYLDHTDPEQAAGMRRAMAMAAEMIEGFSREDPRVLWIRYVFNQGFTRKESFLYSGASLS